MSFSIIPKVSRCINERPTLIQVAQYCLTQDILFVKGYFEEVR